MQARWIVKALLQAPAEQPVYLPVQLQVRPLSARAWRPACVFPDQVSGPGTLCREQRYHWPQPIPGSRHRSETQWNTGYLLAVLCSVARTLTLSRGDTGLRWAPEDYRHRPGASPGTRCSKTFWTPLTQQVIGCGSTGRPGTPPAGINNPDRQKSRKHQTNAQQ